MHNQNNGSIVFNFVFWLLRKKKKSINVYVAVHSDFIAEWGCPRPCQARGQKTPSLTPSSKSSREFKHKPICERVFCSSVIHSSLGISSQTSGVLLASKLPHVLIWSWREPLSTVPGLWCFCFDFSCWEKRVSCVIPVSHTHVGGGWGGSGEL